MTMYLRIILASVFLLASQQLAWACNYHSQQKGGPTALHPRSLDVTFALGDATESGILHAKAAVPSNDDMYAHRRALQRLQRFGNALATTADEGASSFSLLLVENGLWSRHRTTSEGVTFQIRDDGARPDDTVVITGEAVMAAMDAGDLATDVALERGLIVIVPGRSAEIQQILSAFASFAKADNPDRIATKPSSSLIDWSEE